ncbi:hypothetical protein DICVIV_08489 [Dictyocaulus viviparus]|uniref:Uncharacterized protein n=1 Tax=Dictyocaulus viviparus TaxID=29172 RepID=A0A0D8XLN6_DICVI|nr:hypothetical protein DICVIV_08489 [Dictyocaulus viviparus]
MLWNDSNGCSVFIFCTAITVNLYLLIGMHYKRSSLLLPYLFLAVLFTILLILQLFISLLNTASANDTFNVNTVLHILSLCGVLYFEIYSIVIVWRVFIYICDARMHYDMKKRERERLLIEQPQNLDNKKNGNIATITICEDSEVSSEVDLRSFTKQKDQN